MLLSIFRTPPIFQTNFHFPWRFEKSGFHCKLFTKSLQINAIVVFSAQPCENISAPKNGAMVCSGQVTDASCTFSCNPGYDLVGSQSRTCLATSRWGGNWTSCEGIFLM